jgi:hypothetical protein
VNALFASSNSVTCHLARGSFGCLTTARLPFASGPLSIITMLVTVGVHFGQRSTSRIIAHTRSAGALISTSILKSRTSEKRIYHFTSDQGPIVGDRDNGGPPLTLLRSKRRPCRMWKASFQPGHVHAARSPQRLLISPRCRFLFPPLRAGAALGSRPVPWRTMARVFFQSICHASPAGI